MTGDELDPLPPQPHGVPWPIGDWPVGPPADDVDRPALRAAIDATLDPAAPIGETRAVLAAHRGVLVTEAYAGTIERGGTSTPVDADTVLPSWSMAKSVLHAAVGVLVGDGRLELDRPLVEVAPGAVRPWLDDPTDPRRAITAEHLLRFRAGLEWTEAYTADGPSDVVEMLYRSGRPDTAGFAADKPLVHEPGSRAAFAYSSGTSNVLAAIVRELTGPGPAQLAFLQDRLLGPAGITTARPVLDAAGTWVASTHAAMTARDHLRFGLLVLRDGRTASGRVLPEGWVDHGRSMQPDVADPVDGWRHGAHWWGLPDRPDWFFASGYQGQHLAVCPTRDLVVLRLGAEPPTRVQDLTDALAALIDPFPTGHPRRAGPRDDR